MNKKKFILTMVILFLVIYMVFFAFRMFVQYVPDTYVCRQMARDQERMLEKQGLNVLVCRGTARANGEGHVWVAINTSGMLVHFDSIGWYPFIPETMYYDIQIFDSYEDYLSFKLNRN